MQPARPCKLYRHFDASGRLLYVGVAFNVVARTAEHQRSAWFDLVVRIEVERHPDRESAVKAERTAIDTEGPIYNRDPVTMRGKPRAPRPRTGGTKDEVVRVRIPAADKALLEAAAEREGLSLSAWIRQIALRAAGAR